MPNAISGVSEAALARPLFRIRKGELYILAGDAADELYLDKLCPNDGTYYVIVHSARIYEPTVDNDRYIGYFTLLAPPDYTTDGVVAGYDLSASPTFTTSGGLDRVALRWLNPLRLPLLGKLTLNVTNCSMTMVLLIGSSRYTNIARYCQGTRVLLGNAIAVMEKLGKVARATYVDSTVGEVDKSKIDLQAVKTIKKFATRVAYMITGVVAGSSVKCYISEDDAEWTKIWEKVDLPTEETEEYIEVEDITARYIKFTLDANSVVETASLYQYPLFAWVE